MVSMCEFYFLLLEVDTVLDKVVKDLERMKRDTRVQLETITGNDVTFSPRKISSPVRVRTLVLIFRTAEIIRGPRAT